MTAADPFSRSSEDDIRIGEDARWARHTVDAALRRMALLLAASELLMALTGLLDGGLGESLLGRPATWASWLISLGLWLWCTVQQEGTSSYLVFGLAQFTFVAAVTTSATELTNGGSAIDWAPNILALVAGLLLASRAYFITACTALTTVVVITTTMMQSGLSLTTCVVPALTRAIYILCGGWAASGVCQVIRRMATKADTAAAESEQEQVTAARLHSTEAATAELARVLHDSAVNTFAAIASGRLASDPGTVKARCSQDVKTLTDLLHRDADTLLQGPTSWQMLNNEGVKLHLVGVNEHTLTETLATLPAPVAGALMASLGEAIRNVAKHSGVDEATIAIYRGKSLELAVSDNGCGFDGTIPTGRGLQRSIIDRCAEHDISARIISSPGEGTIVRLSYAPPTLSSLDEESERENRAFLTDVVWLTIRLLMACFLVLCTSLTVLYSGDGIERSATVALALMGITSWLVFWRCNRNLSMPVWLMWVLIAVIPIINLAPGWDETGCARVGYQAWGVDGSVLPIFMLVMLARYRWVVPAALVVYLASTTVWLLGVANRVPSTCPSTATTSAAFNVVIVLSLWLFRHTLWELTAKASAASKAATAARLQAAATEAASRVRGVRQAQVLRSSLQLLNQLAGGAASPYDSEVTRRCRSEESYLRELTLLDPSLTYLGEWLARALAVAHQNGASLRIRSIAQDLHDAEMAAFIGNFLIAATQATGLGGIVSFGIYERNQRPIVSVVGNIGALRAAVETTFEREVNWVVSYAELDDEALVELSQWTSSKVEAY